MGAKFVLLRQRLSSCKSALANSCQITINTITHDPRSCLPFPSPPALSSILLGLYPGKQTEGLGICGGVMGARWRRSVTVGVSCQIKEGAASPNPSHSFLKTANVSFEEIIPFGRLIALGNYEPLQAVYGINQSWLPARGDGGSGSAGRDITEEHTVMHVKHTL